jgi:hypothetical protein
MKISAMRNLDGGHTARAQKEEILAVDPEKSLEFRKQMCDGTSFYKEVKKELFTSMRELNNSRIGTRVG